MVDARGTNLPANITSIPLTRAAANLPYGYAVVASDPEGDALDYRLTDAPEGMELDPSTGLISWTPSLEQVGTASVTVQVTDSLGAETLQSYEIAVTDAAMNQAPTITSVPDFVATSGQPYEYVVTATDPENEAIAYELLDAPAGMTIDAATGLVQWTPDAALSGTVFATVVATDARGAAASQRFGISVAPNDAPAILSSPIATAVPDQTYRYDLIARDPNGDRLTYELVDGPAGLTIDELGRLRWSPEAGDAGSYPVTVTVTDAYGATATQSFALTVEIDDEAPVASVLPSRSPIELGQPVTLLATATDNGGVESLVVTANGVPLALDANGLTTLTPEMAGTLVVEATATDAAGNVGTSTFDVFAIDPTDTEAPVIALPDLSDISFTAPTDIVGTVTDDNLDFYTLSVAPVDGGEFTEIFRGTTAVTDGVLGEFDPTLLQNDAYTLRLTAQDTGGNVVAVEEAVNVEGELKLGNFQLSFEDLSIPVAGIPITLTRTYDTLTANRTDDFGYGWRMEFRDTDLRTSLGPDEVFETLGIRSQAFDERTRVYITLPGGQREAFTFAPKRNPISNYFPPISGGDPTLYNPAFEAEPGVTSTLSVQNVTLSRRSDGKFIGLNGGGYNPADTNYGFGGYYVLTTKEGIEYRIDAATGDLLTVTDTFDNTLTFTDVDVTSSTGQKVTFDRDAQGRITGVTDTAGERITYQYDAAGDLISVTDREGATTEFEYSSDREHYLETIVDPLGREVAKTEYDEDGRIDTIFDAFGNPIDFDYDPDNNVETVTTVLDESGATATTIFEYDERGNTVRQRNADGGEIVRTFDAENNVLSETDALGETTTYTYDSNNNQLSETDPNGNTTYFTYSSGNDITEIVDPLGNTTSFSYAGQGRLTGMVDPLGRETTVDLDSRGLMEQLVNEASLSTSTTSYTYDARGYALTQTDSLGVTTTFTRDNLGRALTSSVTVTTPNGPEVLTTSYTYDEEGRQTSITNPEGETRFMEYDDLGREVAMIDARGIRTEHEYNDRGEKTAIRYADGTSELFTYDRAGRQTSMTDRAGRTTVYRYDEMDRRTEAIMPDLTPGDLSDNPRMLMEYNLRGEMTAEIDPNGNRTEYTYDPAGNRIAVNRITADGLTHETQFIYDAADRQVEVIDELGRSTVTTYDAAGRQQITTFADGSQTETAYIQSEGARIVIDENGNPTRHEFDGEGRLIAVEDALSQRTEYTYDERGRLVAQTDAEDHITRYEYDGADRRTAVILPLLQRSESTYDEAGNLLVETNFNGDTIAYEYQQFNNWVDTKTITVDGTVEEVVAYQYTPVGLVSQIDDELGTTVYNYDAQNRMLSRIDPDSASISYTYDLAGNRTSVTSASGTTTYVFDGLNRLIEVSDPDVG
ncbi:MAG: putative Ig domain-containing protein, partial [Cyanobacteria bacterium J06642_2]